MAVKSYRDLIVWQKSMDLVFATYKATRGLPKTEFYGLSAQIQRAAVSIPANIAEGQGRRHLGDYLHHLSVATGSPKELETHFLIAERFNYFNSEEVAKILGLTAEIGRMLTALAQQLRNSRPHHL